MKKILSILTAALMGITMMTVSVKADNEWIEIGDTVYYDTTASGDGWSFTREGSNGTLILTDATISGSINTISIDLTIVLNGSNTINGGSYGINVLYGYNLTIQGDGSLNVSGRGYGISSNNLTITGGTINVGKSGDTGTAVCIDGELSISGNSILDVQGTDRAIIASGGFSIGEGLGITSPAGASIHSSGQTTVNSDGSFATATRIEPAVTITFDANGATSVPTPQTIAKGAKATQPGLSVYDNDLYVLGGWYKNADFSGSYVHFWSDTFDSDTTLYASWERPVEVQVGIWGEGYSRAPIEYITVNGARFPRKVAALVYDGPSTRRGCPISVDAVISEGYGFVEVVKDSDGTHLSDELPYTNDNNDTSWDEPAIAIWLLFGPLKTITFVDEDGTVLQETQVAAGRTPEYTGDTPTKPADKDYTYTFDTWDPEITTVTDDATYTAVYKKKKKSSGSGSSSSTATTTPASDNTWTDTSSTAPAANTYTPPVTPSFRPQLATTAYTVWFETDGGTEIAAQTVNAGTTAARPYDPEKEGFLFSGWYSDKELTEEFDFLAPINANTTVYAKWTEPEEEPAEIVPEPTDEPEPSEAPAPVEPEKKGNGLKYGIIAAILALLGIIFGVTRRKKDEE